MHGMACRWDVPNLRVELVLGVGPLDMLRISNLKIFVQDHIPVRVRRSMFVRGVQNVEARRRGKRGSETCRV